MGTLGWYHVAAASLLLLGLNISVLVLFLERQHVTNDYTTPVKIPKTLNSTDLARCYTHAAEDEDFYSWEDYSYYIHETQSDGVPMTIHMFWETKLMTIPPKTIMRISIMSILLEMPNRLKICLVHCFLNSFIQAYCYSLQFSPLRFLFRV